MSVSESACEWTVEASTVFIQGFRDQGLIRDL